MKELTLKSINIGKFALFTAVVSFLSSLVVVFFLLISLPFAHLPRTEMPFVPGPAIGIVAIIVIPVIYTIIGFISGLIAGVLINVALSIVGGIPMKFKE